MNATAFCLAAGIFLLAHTAPAHAADDASNDVDCAAAAVSEEPLSDRTGTISAMEQLPEACLKRVFVECHRAADQGVLDLGSAAVCSMGYEALLRKGFHGNFQLLLAWWRSGTRVE